MSKIIRFQDNSIACWSRVDLANGDPIWISVAQSGIVIKKSRLGLLGPRLFYESEIIKAANTAQAIDAEVVDYRTPPGLQNPVLRALTQAALDCSSAAELCARLSEAREAA